MAKTHRITQEFHKIAFALESDDITPKQRFALLVSRDTLKWFVSFSQRVQHPSPTELILPDFFEKDVAE